MKRWMNTLLAGLSMAALISGGCAKKDVVKTEEPAAMTTSAEKLKTGQPDLSQTDAAQTAQKPYDKADENKIVAAKPSDDQSALDKAASVFETVYFDFDSSDLRQDSRNVLSKNAEIMLKSKKSANIKIEGHCDERGSAEYNLALGERRAKSVMQYLLTLGVQPERLSVISYGKEKPAVQGNDEAVWAKNRRAEFVLVK